VQGTASSITGRSSAPTPGPEAPDTGFASVASRFGRLERMDSLPPRRATSIAPNTIVNESTVRRNHNRNHPPTQIPRMPGS
jgi:hypothetical protein